MKFRKSIPAMLLAISLGTYLINAVPTNAAASPVMANQQTDKTDGYSLAFDRSHYTVKTLSLNGQTITYRAYENIVYVQHPVDTQYESMNIYVPEKYYEGKSIGTYNAETAPIFLPNTVGGYMPGVPGSPGRDWRSNSPNAAFVALTKGYVVAEPGARGRTTQNEIGEYTGKAPACIVDLKAAVRYLHYNDKIMPGDANKIISNGTSAGGALSALLGASGNNKDYEPYLKAIGAADARDEIFAVSAYCPITNLDHADMAYEWLFNGINDYKKKVFPGGAMPSPGQGKPSIDQGIVPIKEPKIFEETGIMSPLQIQYSDELKKMFPAYLNSLGLKTDKGMMLTLDANGKGAFNDYVKSCVMESAQKALDSGKDLFDLTWLTIQDGKVTEIDFDQYIKYAGRMKTTSAFDREDLSNAENSLFGTATINAQHFTKLSKEHSMVGGSLADTGIIKMMNPMNYIGAKETATAQYWRIRHGAIDRDTSLAIPVILATNLKNKGFNVDFAVTWGQGHGGDYDLDELFSWIDNICLSH